MSHRAQERATAKTPELTAAQRELRNQSWSFQSLWAMSCDNREEYQAGRLCLGFSGSLFGFIPIVVWEHISCIIY